MEKRDQNDIRSVAEQLLAALQEAVAEIEYWHADMLSDEERRHSRGSGWAQIHESATAAIASAKATLKRE
jgi:hypothetical protein